MLGNAYELQQRCNNPSPLKLQHSTVDHVTPNYGQKKKCVKEAPTLKKYHQQ